MKDRTPDKLRQAPLAVSRQDAAALLGISERLLWTMTNAGKIPHVRIGSRVLYPVEALRQWLDEQAQPGSMNGNLGHG